VRRIVCNTRNFCISILVFILFFNVVFPPHCLISFKIFIIPLRFLCSWSRTRYTYTRPRPLQLVTTTAIIASVTFWRAVHGGLVATSACHLIRDSFHSVHTHSPKMHHAAAMVFQENNKRSLFLGSFVQGKFVSRALFLLLRRCLFGRRDRPFTVGTPMIIVERLQYFVLA